MLDAWTNNVFLHSFLMLDDVKKNQVFCTVDRDEILVSQCLCASYGSKYPGSSQSMNPIQFIQSRAHFASISQQLSPSTSILNPTFASAHKPSSTHMLACPKISVLPNGCDGAKAHLNFVNLATGSSRFFLKWHCGKKI